MEFLYLVEPRLPCLTHRQGELLGGRIFPTEAVCVGLSLLSSVQAVKPSAMMAIAIKKRILFIVYCYYLPNLHALLRSQVEFVRRFHIVETVPVIL